MESLELIRCMEVLSKRWFVEVVPQTPNGAPKSIPPKPRETFQRALNSASINNRAYN